jgi:hypothetical protein
MKLLFSAILLSFPWETTAGEPMRAHPNAASFPTKQGTYIHKQWKYVYEIKNEGTRSEVRIGRLFLEGKLIEGEPGELLQELFGHFIYFGDKGWNQGWLNTLTYNRPVFDSNGHLTEKARALLPKSKEAEQGATATP